MGELDRFFWHLMRHVPLLARVPLSSSAPLDAAQWLVRPLCHSDLPPGYFDRVADEFRVVASQVAKIIESGQVAALMPRKPVRLQDKTVAAADIPGLLRGDAAIATLPWVLEVCRLHSITHFGRDSPARLLPAPELFSTLAAARSSEGAATQLGLRA